AIALSPNGSTVASGSSDGTMKLWDVKTRKVIAKWKGHTWKALSVPVYWSANGERVASGSFDGTVRVWGVKRSETVLGSIKTKNMWVYAVVYLPNSTILATGGREDRLKIWDAKSGELLKTLKHVHWLEVERQLWHWA
ncbi:WD40 repeat-like protein, partial [Suillus decipiens]